MIKNIYVVVVVKNENENLRKFCSYYISIGFDKIIIFNDGGDKICDQLKSDFSEKVEIIDQPGDLYRYHEKLNKYEFRFNENLDIRKRCYVEYISIIHSMNNVVILSIDVDEYILFKEGMGIFDFLSEFKGGGRQVLIQVNEVDYNSYRKKYDECIVIKCFPRYLRIMNRVVKKVLQKIVPEYTHPLHNIFLRIVTFGYINNGVTWQSKRYYPGLYLGYDSYKSAVAADLTSVAEFNIHKWKSLKCKVSRVAQLIHYDLIDLGKTIEKFSKRDIHTLGNGSNYRNAIATAAVQKDIELLRTLLEQATRLESIGTIILFGLGWLKRIRRNIHGL